MRRVLIILCGLLAAGLAGWFLLRPAPVVPTSDARPAELPAELPGAGEEPSPPPRAFSRPAVLSPSAVQPAEVAHGAFSGQVLSSATGEGVGGAELTFEAAGAALSTRADASGRFEFLPRQEGLYRLAVITAPGFHPFGPAWGHSPVTLTAARGQRVEALVFHLEPARVLEGVVQGPEGQPVAGAELRIVQGGAEAVATDGRALSGPDGDFTLAAPVGSVLEATHPQWSPGRAVVGERSLLGERVVVRLARPGTPPPGGRIEGRVVDATGQPAPGALITASLRRSFRQRADEPEPAPARAVADAEGAFRLEALSEGVYRLQAVLEGSGRGELGRVRTSGAAVELILRRGARLSGTVRSEAGAPVAAFTLSLNRRRGALARDGFLSAAVVSADGGFAVEDVPPGSYALQVAAFGFAVSDEYAVEVPEAPAQPPPLTVRLSRGGSVSGVVRDEQTRQPVSGARVSMEGGVESVASSFPTSVSTTTDASGAFRLSGLAEGLRSITVQSRAHHGRVLSGLQVETGGELGPLEVALSPLEAGETPQLELVGIGVVLTPRGDVLQVGRVLEGGGAAEAGLRPGDEVRAVDGMTVGALGFEGAINRIRGPEGSAVRLEIRRGEEAPRELVVYRRKVRS